MIVDTNEPEMTPQESPPSYDLATSAGSDNSPSAPHQSYPGPGVAKDTLVHVKHPQQTYPNQSPPPPGPSMPPTSVYHYVNPITREHIASLLPPDHPEMICLQAGGHISETRFGILGILVAVFWFPIGIGLCLLDRRVKCRRCGVVIQDSICG